MQKKNLFRGFTLIEILVVIGIIAILASVVIIAINPARQFAEARNSQRQSNILSILNAIGQNMVDNKGSLVGCTVAASSTIGTASDGKHIDLSACLNVYLPAGIPTDPEGGTPQDTKYEVSYNSASGRYLVCAPQSSEAVLGNPPTLCVIR